MSMPGSKAMVVDETLPASGNADNPEQQLHAAGVYYYFISILYFLFPELQNRVGDSAHTDQNRPLQIYAPDSGI